MANQKFSDVNRELHPRYTDAEKQRAGVLYALNGGNAAETARMVGCTATTIHTWSREDDAFLEALERTNERWYQTYSLRMGGILDQATEELVNRLSDPDKREKISERDLVNMQSQLFHTKTVADQRPRQKESISEGRLKELVERFERIAEAKVIEGEVIDDG